MQNEMPKHVAIIMDGNGRWAKRQGLLRIKGHETGVKRVEEIIQAASDMGIKYLTLYTFSKENWRRPKEEVDFLMGLLSGYLDAKIDSLMKNNVRFSVIGEIEDLAGSLQKKLRQAMELTGGNSGLTLNLALSYSSRREIVLACRKIAEKVKRGELAPEAINESAVSANLFTAAIPDPELLIRTSGEMRISNFLLWQISYAELYVTEKFWPEFTREELEKAIADYRQRERRFGAAEAEKTRS